MRYTAWVVLAWTRNSLSSVLACCIAACGSGSPTSVDAGSAPAAPRDAGSAATTDTTHTTDTTDADVAPGKQATDAATSKPPSVNGGAGGADGDDAGVSSDHPGMGGSGGVAAIGGMGGQAASCHGTLRASGRAAAGSGGALPSTSALGQACNTIDALSCAGVATTERLRCDGAHWTQAPSCRPDERCSTADAAACEPLQPACESPGQSVCSNGRVFAQCSADLTSLDRGQACADSTPYCVAAECVASSCAPPATCNALQNPDFDADVRFWEAAVDGEPAPTWSNDDSMQCAQSGSLDVGSTTVVHQCAAITAGTLVFGADFLVPPNSSNQNAPVIELILWTGQHCDGVGSGQVEAMFGDPIASPIWQPSSTIWAPYDSNFASVDFRVRAPIHTRIDNAFLTLR